MDAVGRDHDIGRGPHTVGERDDGVGVILLEADAPVTGVDDGRGQPIDEHGKQVGAVHAVEFDRARQFRGPHRRGIGSIGAAKLRVDPPGPPAGQPVSKAEPPQHPYAIRLDCDAGANLGQSRSLLVKTHVHAALEQGIDSGDTTDAAADDRNA